MLYTVTLILKGDHEGDYLEEVYLLSSDIEESSPDLETQILEQLLLRLDLSGFSMAGEADIRPLLFNDFDSPVFARHFEDIQAYTQSLGNWQPEQTDNTGTGSAFVGLLIFQSAYILKPPHLYCEELNIIQANNFASAEQEYRQRQQEGQLTYLAGDPPSELQVSLYSASPLQQIQLLDRLPTLLLSRRFSDLKTYCRAMMLSEN